MTPEDDEYYPPILSEGDEKHSNITSPARQSRVKYSILIMYVCLILVAVGNLLYTNKVNHDADHQWCQTLIGIVQPGPGVPPPTTERGIQQLANLRKLAHAKGCIK